MIDMHLHTKAIVFKFSLQKFRNRNRIKKTPTKQDSILKQTKKVSSGGEPIFIFVKHVLSFYLTYSKHTPKGDVKKTVRFFFY